MSLIHCSAYLDVRPRILSLHKGVTYLCEAIILDYKRCCHVGHCSLRRSHDVMSLLYYCVTDVCYICYICYMTTCFYILIFYEGRFTVAVVTARAALSQIRIETLIGSQANNEKKTIYFYKIMISYETYLTLNLY